MAEAHIAHWNREAVWPLRILRTKMKQRYGVEDAAIEATRSAIKKAELQAERVVQIRLEQLARHWPARAQSQPVAAGHNLAVYARSGEHTSELQSRGHLVCRLLLEKKDQIEMSDTDE